MKEKSIKGITLVALVVTIIILLILAGVAITALTQTGLLENAKQAKNAMENAQNTENITFAEYSEKINEIVGGSIRENENNMGNISEYSLGDAEIFDSRLKDLNGGYKIVGNTVYVYITATVTKSLSANNSWAIITNIPEPQISTPLQILAVKADTNFIGGINCGVNSTESGVHVLRLGTSSLSIPVNSTITIKGSYQKNRT